MENIILSGININKSFPEANSRKQVLKNVNLDIKDGEFLTVMGPSGSGKSTLLFAISGLDIIDSGSVMFEDRDLILLGEDELSEFRRKSMGFVFQNPTLMKNLNILDNIILPGLKEGADKESVIKDARLLMNRMGILDLENRDINKVSGGEMQRAGICRALINDPKIIFGDEPTGALNSKTSDEIMDIFLSINSEGKTIMLVTHDPKVAAKSHRVLFMKDGQIVEELSLTNYSKSEALDKVIFKIKELEI